MLSRRIIPCLDVREGRVVKGTRFRDHVDMGGIEELAARYFEARTTDAEERELRELSRVGDSGMTEELRVLFGGLDALAGERMPVLTSRNGKRRCRGDSVVKRANTPTQEGWRRKRERSRQR